MMALVRKMIEPVSRRVMLMVSRAVIRAVDDARKIQEMDIEISSGEVRTQVESVQRYGFTSVPLAGGEAVALSVGGNRDHVLVIATDDRRYRLKSLAGGEVAIYDDQGSKIVLKRGNKIEITAETVDVIADSVNLGSSAGINELVDKRFFALYNAHTHPVSGAATAAPVILIGPAGTPENLVSTTKAKAS